MEAAAGPGIAERLDAIEARFAIADLIHGYARHVRRGETDLAAGLFLSDGVFEIGEGEPAAAPHCVRTRLEGADAVRGYLAAMQGRPQPLPIIHNLSVEVNGDAASASSVMTAQVFGTSHSITGEYRDELRRVARRWYFVARTYTIFVAPAG